MFLDHVGACWQYEPEGFDISSAKGRYLPDFRVTGFPVSDWPYADNRPNTTVDFWLEVKGTGPILEERNALREVACGTGIPGFFLVGVQEGMKNGKRRKLEFFTEIVDESMRPLDPWEFPPQTRLPFMLSDMFFGSQLPHSCFSPIRAYTSPDRYLQIDKEVRDRFIDELDSLIGRFGYLAVPLQLCASAAAAALSARFEFGQSGPT